MVRRALSQVLEETSDQIQVVGQASNSIEALQLVESLLPDVLIVDYTMPEFDGPGVIEAVRKLELPVKLLVLTVHEDAHYAVTILDRGADGFVVKSAAVEELVTAIDTVRGGGSYISPKIAQQVREQLERSRKKRSGLNALSPRGVRRAEGVRVRDGRIGVCDPSEHQQAHCRDLPISTHDEARAREHGRDHPLRTRAWRHQVEGAMVRRRPTRSWAGSSHRVEPTGAQDPP